MPKPESLAPCPANGAEIGPGSTLKDDIVGIMKRFTDESIEVT